MEHGLFDTYSLCCYINAPLCVFPLFISSRSLKKKKRDGVGMLSALQSRLHSSVTRASQLFPFLSQKSQPASAGAQMNDCCLLRRIISQEMRVSPLLSICSSLCFSSGKQNAVTGERGEADWSANPDESLDDDKI